MAKVNKISSFKSFTEVRTQDTVMKLREENELKRKESVSKLATILDEMGLTSFEGLEEDQKQQIISKIFGDVSEEDIKEIEVEVEEVTESVITEKIDRSVAKRMEGLYLYKKVDQASEILIEVIDDMLEEEFEQEESIEFISLKTQELLEKATYATYESAVTEAIDVTGKRDAKKVFTAYKRIMDSMPGISQSKNNNLIKGCIKVLGMYALEDANFHREMSCMNKIKGSISPVEIKVAGLANLAVKVSVNKIKDALQQVTSKVSTAGDWSGIAIAEGTAIYLDSIGATKEAQDMLDMFNSAFESTEELGQKVIEGRAFAAAAKKAKDEGLEEFEFNGKKYPVLIKENTLTESLILEGTRGQFGKIDNKGNITSVYTHYDSYPDNMLPIIKKSFKNGKNVDDVLSKGANSGLSTDISKINFYNDGTANTTGSIKNIDNYLKDADRDGGAEFVYLWDEKSKKWMMADLYQGSGLVPAFESVVTEAKFVKDFNRDVLNAKTKEEVLELYPNAEFFIGKLSHFFGELDNNLFFRAHYAGKNDGSFKIESVYSKKGSNYVHLYNEAVVTEGKSELNAFLAMISKDYQFDKKHDDYTGFLNTDPSDMDDVAIEFINNVDKYKSLMKKHGLSLEPGYSDKEAIFVKESVVNEAKELFQLDIDSDEHGALGLSVTMKELKDVYNKNKKDINDVEDLLLKFVYAQPEDFAANDTEGMEISGANVGDVQTMLAKAFGIKESVVNEAEIKSDEEFQEYAFTILKKAFGDDFDEAKGQEIVDGILSKSDGDYGAAVGMLTSSLG